MPEFFLLSPIILGTGLQIWQVHSEGPSEQKPIKKIRRKVSVGVVRDSPKFLGAPYYLRNG